MTLETASENTHAQQTDIQLSLSQSDAEQLRVTLPWLLHALAARPTVPPRQRERRRTAHTILGRLQAVLSGQLPEAEENRESHR
jgi:hypothetical protein